MTGRGASLEGPAVADRICPYLGMVGDRKGHHSFPSRAHLCHAGEPAHIGLGFQADYCLGGEYPSCARYQRAEDAQAAGRLAAAEHAVAGSQPVLPSGSVRAHAETPTPLAASSAGLAAEDRPSDRDTPTEPDVVPAAGVDAAAGAADARSTDDDAVPLAGAAAVSAAAMDSTPPPHLTAVPPGSGHFGRVRPPDERGGGSRLVSALLGLALLATLVAFAIAGGFIRLPGPVAVVPTATVTLSPTATPALPTDSPSPAPTASPTPSPAPTPTSTLDTGEVLHVVQPNQTLTSIADLYGVPVEAIVARNGLTDPNHIVVGQTLIIPVGAASPSPSVSPTASSSPGPSVSPIATSFTYTVQAGDTLSSIAIRFGVNIQAILDANPEVSDPDRIFVGQRLVIPAP